MKPDFNATEQAAQTLLRTIKARLPQLSALLEKVSSHWHGEDGFYRFYHQSFKVYHLQADTLEMEAALRALQPERRGPEGPLTPAHSADGGECQACGETPGPSLNPWFEKIIREGTGKEFQMEHNRRWLEETRPILEAFFHARTMLEFVVRYGKELEEAPRTLPSGWAAVLYLYHLR